MARKNQIVLEVAKARAANRVAMYCAKFNLPGYGTACMARAHHMIVARRLKATKEV